MPFVTLQRHPDYVCDAVTAIGVEVASSGDLLHLRYRIEGDISRLLLPSRRTAERMDGLWQHTCCEAFIIGADATDYYEFNFSPSTAWSAYRFNSYRAGMTPAEVSTPIISMHTTSQAFELDVSVKPEWMLRGAHRMGLACVVEEANGQFSYWALSHPPGKPDFHHRSSFTLDLASYVV